MIHRVGLAWVFGFLSVAVVHAQGTPDVLPGPTYQAMCDASAAVALGNHGFIVGNDEDNVLRVFSRTEGGPPTAEYDMSDFLRTDDKHPEADLEGATWLDDKIFWITSHARNKDGKPRPNRHRLFATEFRKVDGRTTLRPVGIAYRFLLDDLVADPRLLKYDLRRASASAPKSDFALNIESLASTPEGHLLVGFRNPIVDGKALIVRITNPIDVTRAQAPALADPIELDLGGLGLRGMEYHATWNGYVLLAGPKDSGDVHLYTWTGQPTDNPKRVEGMDLLGTTPESFVCYTTDHGAELQLMCDDGSRELNGTDCKALDNPLERRFRTWFVRNLAP